MTGWRIMRGASVIRVYIVFHPLFHDTRNISARIVITGKYCIRCRSRSVRQRSLPAQRLPHATRGAPPGLSPGGRQGAEALRSRVCGRGGTKGRLQAPGRSSTSLALAPGCDAVFRGASARGWHAPTTPGSTASRSTRKIVSSHMFLSSRVERKERESRQMGT